MSQSLNRYSYVMNNPLSLIDPSGYSWVSKAFKKAGRWFDKAFGIVGNRLVGGGHRRRSCGLYWIAGLGMWACIFGAAAAMERLRLRPHRCPKVSSMRLRDLVMACSVSLRLGSGILERFGDDWASTVALMSGLWHTDLPGWPVR